MMALKAISRSYDWKTLEEVAKPHSKEWVGFTPKELVANKGNILITDGNKNFALFEYEQPGVYYGHYIFTHRGVRTYTIAKEFLSYFLENYPSIIIIGLVPTEHKGAVRLTNKLGFKFNRIVETVAGPHYEVSLTKRKFINE